MSAFYFIILRKGRMSSHHAEVRMSVTEPLS